MQCVHMRVQHGQIRKNYRASSQSIGLARKAISRSVSYAKPSVSSKKASLIQSMFDRRQIVYCVIVGAEPFSSAKRNLRNLKGTYIRFELPLILLLGITQLNGRMDYGLSDYKVKSLLQEKYSKLRNSYIERFFFSKIVLPPFQNIAFFGPMGYILSLSRL